MKSGTVFHNGLFRTYTGLFQEGYKLYYRQMVAQLCINKKKSVFHNRFYECVHPVHVAAVAEFLSLCTMIS